MTLTLEAEKIIARCRQLATLTDVPGGTTRTYLSPAMRQANDLVAGWMKEAGLTVTQDSAGNLRAVRNAGAPRLVLASHLDTVINAGAFDGPLGVILGIEAAAATTSGNGLEVIAFAEEEGVRYSTPFLGSKAVVGALDLELQDHQGVTVGEAIRAYGLNPDDLSDARLDAEVFAYLEVHIEQGPVLGAESRPIAAVSGIAGQSRLRLTFTGCANHAGTTPMALRQDALAAAARFIVHVESHAQHTPHLVATVGEIGATPGLVNVIPGQAIVSLDVRHTDDRIRLNSVATLLRAAESAAGQRRVSLTYYSLLEQTAVPMHVALTRCLIRAAQSVGCDATAIPSGAGHDAMIVAPYVPAAMLFVRTPGGLSHHPDESVTVEDVGAALATTMQFIQTLTPEAIACTA